MLHISLFGRFSIQHAGGALPGLDAGKLQELLSYLLVYRDRPHTREALGSLLWGNVTTAQSRKYLRQALWQLQAALESASPPPSAKPILLVDSETVQFNPAAEVWLDLAEFQQAYAHVRGVPGRALDPTRAQVLRAAAELYRAELLAGWFQEWCLIEREQCQHLYLVILDKLMDYSERQGDYEAGLDYGGRVLSCDPAREATHRRLMRLECLSGDRTGALRQYQQCVEILRRELAVPPSKKTRALYEQIRADEFPPAAAASPAAGLAPDTTPRAWTRTLAHLKQAYAALNQIRAQVKRDIDLVERFTKKPSA